MKRFFKPFISPYIYNSYGKYYPVRYYLLRLGGVLSTGMLVKYILDEKKERYLHGETAFRQSSRKRIKKICNKLDQVNAAELDPDDLNLLMASQNKCREIDECIIETDKKMTRRRETGLGNPLFWGAHHIPVEEGLLPELAEEIPRFNKGRF